MLRIKQYSALLLILVLVVAVLYVNDPFWGKHWLKTTEAELNRLQLQLEQVKDLHALKGKMQGEFGGLTAELRRQTGPYVASPDDPFGWAARQLSLEASDLGIQLGDIVEVAPGRIPTRRHEARRVFQPYRIRAECYGTLSDVLKIIENLQDRNPYVALVELAIGPTLREQDALRRVTLILEWPSWSEKTSAPIIAL
jgi:hypothetical protein